MYSDRIETIQDRREMLRVKIKSLGEEARIIRKEERRTYGALRNELWFHRTHDVRSEARAAVLAYGIIRGLSLEQMEAKSFTPPNWERVRALLKKYGPKGIVLPAYVCPPGIVGLVRQAA